MISSLLEFSNLFESVTKVLTADIEVIVSCDDHIGCSALLWLGGTNSVAEQLTLGGRQDSGRHIRVGHNVVDTNAQVFDDLQLVVGVPEVACGRGSQHVTVLNLGIFVASEATQPVLNLLYNHIEIYMIDRPD